MAHIIKVSGHILDIDLPNNDKEKLSLLQSVVGGYIEVVPTNDGRIMAVNEEGKLLGLEVNIPATALITGTGRALDFIVGDVVVLSRSEIS